MMKKTGLAILIALLAICLLTSCSDSMDDALSKFMNSISGNVFEDLGLSDANIGAANTAIAAISNTETSTVPTEIGGITVPTSLDAADKIVAPLSSDAVAKLQDALSVNDASEAKVLEELGKTVTDADKKTAVENTMTLLDDAIEAAKAFVPASYPEVKEILDNITLPPMDGDITQGDVVATQLLVTIVSDVSKVVKAASDGTLSDADVLATIGSVISKIETAKNVSDINVSVMDEDLLSTLSSALFKDKSGKSAKVAAPSSVESWVIGDRFDDVDAYLPPANALIGKLKTLLKVTKNGEGNAEISDAAWSHTLQSLSSYRAKIELVAALVPFVSESHRSGIKITVSDVSLYAISVAILEAHSALTEEECKPFIVELLNDNKDVLNASVSATTRITFNTTLLTTYNVKTNVKTFVETDKKTNLPRITRSIDTLKYVVDISGTDTLLKKLNAEDLFITGRTNSLYTKVDQWFNDLKTWANE